MKNKFLKILLCTASLSAAGMDHPDTSIPRPITSTISTLATLSRDASDALAARVLPSQFIGQKQYDPKIVQAYRQHVKNSGDQERALLEHCDALAPLAEALSQYIQANDPTHPLAQHFLTEISDHILRKEITPLWIMMASLRYAAAVSNVSADENDLFMHVINPNIFEGILKRNAYKNQWTTLQSIELTDKRNNTIETFYSLQNLHHTMLNSIGEEVEKTFPPAAVYPMAGVGKFGLSFLLRCYNHDTFLLGLPKKKSVGAHGTNMSRVGFIVHDLLHRQVDPGFRGVKKHVAQKADIFVGAGGDAEQFIRFYSPVAVYKHTVLKGFLDTLQTSFQNYLISHYGKSEFLKTMGGAFMVYHEYPTSPEELLDLNSLENIIKKLAINTKNTLSSKDVWESPFDPLQTSPKTGKSALSQKAIIEGSFRNSLLQEDIWLPQSYHTTSPTPDRSAFIEKMVSKAEVVSSQRFIDVKFSLKNGQKFTYTFTTLFHKWHNMDDAIGLLKMAGVSIEKPDLSLLNTEDSRKMAQDTLRTVRKEVKTLVDHFQDRALFFATLKDKEGKSLADTYFNWHFNLQAKIDAVTAKALK